MSYQHRSILVDGLLTHFLEAGDGDPVVLLHGGEFGASAEIGWEEAISRAVPQLPGARAGHARLRRLGQGGRLHRRPRHADPPHRPLLRGSRRRLCAFRRQLDGGHQPADHPHLGAAGAAVRSAVAICGGGEIQKNRHTTALYEYDATVEAMRAIVEALFFDPAYPADEAYVGRRYESSIAPGAWESLAAARFRRPGLEPPPTPSSTRAYERITVPVLMVEGAGDKLLPAGWAAEIAGQITGARSAVIDHAGHCPQIEQPEALTNLVLEFLAG